MNYIKHLTAFFDKVLREQNLNPSHISLYMALFQFWNLSRFQNPICISRDDVMSISKIGSKSTYHKCMKELHEMEFIVYDPSYNPFKGSLVVINTFSNDGQPDQKTTDTPPKNNPLNGQVNGQVNGQALDKLWTGTGTGSGQALVSNINKINKRNLINIVNGNEQKKISEMEVSILKKTKEKKSTPAFFEKKIIPKNKQKDELLSNPTFEEVHNYFSNQSFPEIEAQKFFNYYASTGWLVGGRTPMVNWQSAAQNWILNAPKFYQHDERNDRAKNLNTTTDKDYSEPL